MFLEFARDSKVYVNSSGGKTLYSHENFMNNDIELKFLSLYDGSYSSVFERLLLENIYDLKNEINSNLLFN